MRETHIVVKDVQGYTFYEVKATGSAKSCIRDAMGQLMEYAYWPGRKNASKIVIVGEEEMDLKTANYLRFLRENFDLPIRYESIAIDKQDA